MSFNQPRHRPYAAVLRDWDEINDQYNQAIYELEMHPHFLKNIGSDRTDLYAKRAYKSIVRELMRFEIVRRNLHDEIIAHPQSTRPVVAV